jgi:hypothetical protein
MRSFILNMPFVFRQRTRYWVALLKHEFLHLYYSRGK